MSEEFDRLKRTLQQGSTSDEARKQAADAFRGYNRARTRNSRPFLVALSGDRSTPVEQIPDRMERDPVFYEKIKKIILSG